jgi:hypothetical protein
MTREGNRSGIITAGGEGREQIRDNYSGEEGGESVEIMGNRLC